MCCKMGSAITMVATDECLFDHDEADVNIVNYLLRSIDGGKFSITVLSDDTDVFVLLV